jgi:hypothetical protein
MPRSFHEALRLTERALGKEHLSYAVCLNNLAACHEVFDQCLTSV